MSARDRILGRLQKSGPVAALAPPVVPGGIAMAKAEKIDLLSRSLTAAHAEVFRLDAATAPSGVAHWLAHWCKERGLTELLTPDGPLPYGLDQLDGVTVSRFNRPLEACKEHLFNAVPAGLTVADCAVAGNGTLVLRSGPQQPRSLSLVPPVHLCLIDAARIHADMASALAAEAWAGAMPSNLIYISGPSKTADIQQTLAYGAHGPKELIVFIIDEVQA